MQREKGAKSFWFLFIVFLHVFVAFVSLKCFSATVNFKIIE
jgi:hypothetical protein